MVYNDSWAQLNSDILGGWPAGANVGRRRIKQRPHSTEASLEAKNPFFDIKPTDFTGQQLAKRYGRAVEELKDFPAPAPSTTIRERFDSIGRQHGCTDLAEDCVGADARVHDPAECQRRKRVLDTAPTFWKRWTVLEWERAHAKRINVGAPDKARARPPYEQGWAGVPPIVETRVNPSMNWDAETAPAVPRRHWFEIEMARIAGLRLQTEPMETDLALLEIEFDPLDPPSRKKTRVVRDPRKSHHMPVVERQEGLSCLT